MWDAHDFLHALLNDGQMREICLEIASKEKSERAGALRELGFDFTPRQIDDAVCQEFLSIPKDKRGILGEGDIRDLVMKLWGNHMG